MKKDVDQLVVDLTAKLVRDLTTQVEGAAREVMVLREVSHKTKEKTQ